MGPRCSQYNDAGQATVHKQIPEFLTKEMDGFEKYGSKYQFENFPKPGWN